MKNRVLVVLNILCVLCLGCPNAENEPNDEKPNTNFQQVAADTDAGLDESNLNSELIDSGDDEVDVTPDVRDAGNDEQNVRPPRRDSGVSDERCTVADLIYTAEPRDANGACSDACASGTIEFVGKVYNPCANAIEFTTNNSCIVSHWEWHANDQAAADSRRMSPMCGQAITTHRLQGGAFQEQSSGLITDFTAGNWSLKITFSSFSSGNAISVSPDGAQASVTFSSL